MVLSIYYVTFFIILICRMSSIICFFHNSNITHVDYFSNAPTLKEVIQIPARDYILTFKVEAPKLGDCALKMDKGNIKICKEKFGGNQIFIPKASTGVDFSKVETADDILTHGMGGFGANIGVLGLAGVGMKVNVAVTTKSSNKDLTLMNTYDLQRGTLTLHNPQPLTEIGSDGALYLSEIDLGGNEMLIVTMEFESVEARMQVDVSIQIKVLFIKMSAKLNYVHQNFEASTKTRVQFKSSWRPHLDKTFTDLGDAIKEVKTIEEMYTKGPIDLIQVDINDPKIHSNYYFSTWKSSLYGKEMNMAVINNDLDQLNQQNLELQTALHRIKELLEWKIWDSKTTTELQVLNGTMSSLYKEITEGIQSYPTLSINERTKLKNIYGENLSPEYYTRKLKQIVGY